MYLNSHAENIYYLYHVLYLWTSPYLCSMWVNTELFWNSCIKHWFTMTSSTILYSIFHLCHCVSYSYNGSNLHFLCFHYLEIASNDAKGIATWLLCFPAWYESCLNLCHSVEILVFLTKLCLGSCISALILQS